MESLKIQLPLSVIASLRDFSALNCHLGTLMFFLKFVCSVANLIDFLSNLQFLTLSRREYFGKNHKGTLALEITKPKNVETEVFYGQKWTILTNF